ncbi:MAG: cell division protein FtsQ/DivIB [Betaproteobacteria bacterium]|nr:cell division protein FtsQ/DivIB [Betaproteobacteria bacterium]
MWDNPRLLNAAAGFLVGLVALAAALVGAHRAASSPMFALHAVELLAPPERAPRSAVESAIRAHLASNFFAVDVAALRAALEQVPWVRAASVRRRWPDRLEVALVEHVALARWGDEALVSIRGERFAATSDAPLPLFVGPLGAEAEVARGYARFAPLVEPLGSPLERVMLSARRGWQLRLANGMNLMLGRDAERAEERLRRYVEIHPKTKSDYVDLRYPNGFAVRMN